MTGSIGNEYDTVIGGSQKAAQGLPNPTGGKPGAGVDPRLTNAVDHTSKQTKDARNKVSDRSDKTAEYAKGLKDIQERGGRDVQGSGNGGDSGKSARSAMPTMPQVPQQAASPQPQASTPAPQPSAPSVPPPSGLTNIDPKVLEELVKAVKERQEELGPDAFPSSGPGAPQRPQPLDVSQVSLEKYPGGVLSKEQTAGVIDEALTINGIPNDPGLRAQWQELYQHMAEHESSRNPNAGNNSDSNATGSMMEDGYYANSSRGIWQCIPSTFAAYHMGGTSNSIFDPLSSCSASINYVMQTYHVSPDGSGLDAFMARQGVGTGSYQGY